MENEGEAPMEQLTIDERQTFAFNVDLAQNIDV